MQCEARAGREAQSCSHLRQGRGEYASVAEARSFASNVGSDVVFDFAAGEQLIVENIAKAQITGADLLI